MSTPTAWPRPRLLPKVPPPLQDELLSSWTGRLAAANYIRIEHFLKHLGLPTKKLWRLDVSLTDEQSERLAAATGRSSGELAQLTFSSMPANALPFISQRDDFQPRVGS